MELENYTTQGNNCGGKTCIICDIDNVFLDSREWNSQMPRTRERKDWEEFQTKVHLCKPNYEIINQIVALAETNAIIFITGREGTEYLKNETIKQIIEYSNGRIGLGNRNKLYMRMPADYREASEAKEEILKELMKEYRPVIAIDDDPNNIEMYEKYNIPTIHYTKFLER